MNIKEINEKAKKKGIEIYQITAIELTDEMDVLSEMIGYEPFIHSEFPEGKEAIDFKTWYEKQLDIYDVDYKNYQWCVVFTSSCSFPSEKDIVIVQFYEDINNLQLPKKYKE
ncbi:hypothetical protein [Fusobacterium necrophorum]|jgi:hypothetical protein|uniref:Uncharacterized protein n=3 Tax=Fusobacterium necrophorum TaxID=859 RepID=A0A162J7K7_9FUSO|nr:hypothetical protein [Fusobacterium necrophorum]KYL05283.1 hypothetical protein A2J07_00680 [Fusobacterium necrophorum subsp. funduliforme]